MSTLAIILIAAMTGFCAYGLFTTDLALVFKIVLIVVFAAKTMCFWLYMKKDTRMKIWYVSFLPVDIAVLVTGILYNSIALVFVSAIGLSFTVARIAYFIKINGKKK